MEGAVAGVLWNIVDPKNDDPMQEDFQWIWNVIYFHKPQNMMQFLDHWNGGAEDELCTVCRDHGISMFRDIETVFDNDTFFIAGDTAYCTDVLGSAKIAFGLAKGGAYENPEGRTETIIQQIEHDTGNLILVGGPAVSPLADEFDNIFGITYDYYPGVSFTIYWEVYSIGLNLSNYPGEDICIVYIGQQNGRNIMIVWGYGWEGTYAGSAFIGDVNNWYNYPNAHLLFLRWVDSNEDGLVQPGEYYVESWA